MEYTNHGRTALMRFLFLLLLLVLPVSAHANEAGFAPWLYQFKQRAAIQGLTPQFLNYALTGVEYKPRVIELDQQQPEGKKTFAQYRESIVSSRRIEDGRARLHENWSLLNQIS